MASCCWCYLLTAIRIVFLGHGDNPFTPKGIIRNTEKYYLRHPWKASLSEQSAIDDTKIQHFKVALKTFDKV